MTKDVLAVDKDDRLQTVIDVMLKHRVSKLVVLDKKEVVGVITDGDIADELGAIKNRGVPATHLHASSAMRRKFPTITADTPLDQILTALTDDAGILPVLHDKTPIGVVTASDVLSLVTSTKPLADVMTNHLHVVSPSDRVIHARRLMIDHHVERLPVLDGGRLVGIVGEIDIANGFSRLKATVADHHQPAALTRFLVQDVMQQTVITATPETTAREAVEMMRKEDVGSLPVVRGDRIVGIVTRSDLLKLIRA
ncbi:MAG TPA: CBS domain-containing protein [Candidatus Thermoplasmatota archaeon]|nr:CBS domain-containing protein [Candidatus Thermoplasmatota archaeon]